MKKLEDDILKGIADNDTITEETKALYEIKLRKAKGYEAIHKIHSINERLKELNDKIVEEENDRKLEKVKQFELAANRSLAEQKIRDRLERRKDEADKDARRRVREEKRKRRKMSKKLDKLKEQEHEKQIREVGLSSLGDLSRVVKRKSSDRDYGSSTESSKSIKVITKTGSKKKDEEKKPEKPEEVKFEKEIKGKKHTIDSEFLQKFGIQLD